MAGIKETLEVVELLKKMGEAVKTAKADGSIDWRDLTKMGPVVGALKAAVADGKLVPAELKDLTTEEIEVLIPKMAEAVQSLVDAIVS